MSKESRKRTGPSESPNPKTWSSLRAEKEFDKAFQRLVKGQEPPLLTQRDIKGLRENGRLPEIPDVLLEIMRKFPVPFQKLLDFLDPVERTFRAEAWIMAERQIKANQSGGEAHFRKTFGDDQS